MKNTLYQITDGKYKGIVGTIDIPSKSAFESKRVLFYPEDNSNRFNCICILYDDLKVFDCR